MVNIEFLRSYRDQKKALGSNLDMEEEESEED